jgi:hypothetical protein
MRGEGKKRKGFESPKACAESSQLFVVKLVRCFATNLCHERDNCKSGLFICLTNL